MPPEVPAPPKPLEPLVLPELNVPCSPLGSPPLEDTTAPPSAPERPPAALLTVTPEVSRKETPGVVAPSSPPAPLAAWLAGAWYKVCWLLEAGAVGVPLLTGVT